MLKNLLCTRFCDQHLPLMCRRLKKLSVLPLTEPGFINVIRCVKCALEELPEDAETKRQSFGFQILSHVPFHPGGADSEK